MDRYDLVCIDAVFLDALEGFWLGRKSEQEKDLEILLLRRQLEIANRGRGKSSRLSRADKFTLTVLAARLKAVTGWPAKQFRGMLRLVQPETVFRWDRELVKRKWTFQHHPGGGRPRTAKELESLIVRLARENHDWGNARIEGELVKLGYEISDETVANILRRYGIPPVPERGPSLSWRKLMSHYKNQILACDFFSVETFFLQTLYVLFFVELGTRRVHLAGCTAHPDSGWVTQQVRQMIWELEDRTHVSTS